MDEKTNNVNIDVHVSKNLNVYETYFYIKKQNIFFIWLLGELNTGIKFIKTFQKSSLSQCVHVKKYHLCIWTILGVATAAFSKNFVSNLSVKRHAYGVANLALIAVPETCCLILLLNSKKLFFNRSPHLHQIFYRNRFFVLLI